MEVCSGLFSYLIGSFETTHGSLPSSSVPWILDDLPKVNPPRASMVIIPEPIRRMHNEQTARIPQVCIYSFKA